MTLPRFIVGRLKQWSERVMASRPRDFAIGGDENPYMLRWWIIPRNRWFNVYLHHILRSDDDRALHDHPWLNCSILISGCYFEHVIRAGGIHQRRLRVAGDIKLRRSSAAHRLEVIPGKRAITLFVTGPVIRNWGFHCPDRGWRYWEDFTAPADKGQIGRGCGEMDKLLAAPRPRRLFTREGDRRR
jgi:hypothetical protein